MDKELAKSVRLNDYSLVGPNAVLAVDKGLADAKWYSPPVPKQQLRALLERRDGPAIRDTLLWFALLAAFGSAGYLLWGSWWAILPFAVYGVLYASVSDSRWHETSHGTPFKTDWMNNALYELASFMVMRESTPWRWSHTRHHSDTTIVGRDPEIAVPRPANLLTVCLKFTNLPSLRKYVPRLFRHSFGRMTPDERTYIPQTEYGKVFLRARIYLLIYAVLIAVSIYTRSLLPLMFVGLPNLYGAWLMVVYGLTQHAGLAEDVLDHRLNTRTVYMNRVHRFLYWNMGYHLEHHLFPLVPYHALPKLHELVKSDTPPAYHGLIEAYREIVPALLRQSKDATYFVKRQLPATSRLAETGDTSRRLAGAGMPVVDGWIEIGESQLLQKEDVLRFDHDEKTYAIYRTADGGIYATDGLCTHGNAHLADGLVMGDLVECAKHNGRFDIRDGSPQRLPVCVGLKTYTVRERDGKLLLDLGSAGGYGVTQAAVTHSFRVVSNQNVATFIKELVLEHESAADRPDYQPGDYLQIDIPPYPERSLENVEVQAPFLDAWKAERIFSLKAGNPAPARRNYSLASNPASDKLFRFNVRLATPPPGQTWNAGIGSSYIFGLKAGDRLTAIGPFGQFHIKQTQREKVYLGGGSGMAPLRSHIASLLETQKTQARVSFWYGARSLQELFYQEFFEDLARRYENFTFHVALSEPRPEDHWQSHTGFIHQVLKQAYLDSHPDPKQVDYYLCGPPVMIHAAVSMLKELGVEPEQIAFDEF